MERVERWWNGTWGRLARRDVELWKGTRWRVVTRAGGAEGRETERWFDSEHQAREWLRRCLDDGRHQQWKEMPRD